MSNLKIFSLGVLALGFILIYKTIYKDILAFDFANILYKLTDKNSYQLTLLENEPSIILSIFNTVVENEVKLNTVDVMARLSSIFPFVNNFIDTTVSIRFSEIVKNSIFEANYGLANSLWGEIYAMLGSTGLYFFFSCWTMLMLKSKTLLESRKFTKFIILPGVAYLSFYIHRLDFIQVTSVFKLLFLALIIYKILNILILAVFQKNLNVKIFSD